MFAIDNASVLRMESFSIYWFVLTIFALVSAWSFTSMHKLADAIGPSTSVSNYDCNIYGLHCYINWRSTTIKWFAGISVLYLRRVTLKGTKLIFFEKNENSQYFLIKPRIYTHLLNIKGRTFEKNSSNWQKTFFYLIYHTLKCMYRITLY